MSKTPIEVTVQICDSVAMLLTHPIDWQTLFQRWQDWLMGEYDLPVLARACELTLRLTDNQEMQALNQRFRQQNKPTDVLSFPAVPMPFLPCCPLGDIVIAVPTAQTQAIAQGSTLEQELIWLTSHGFLHLLGWDHPDEASLAEMWHIQQTLMQLIHLR
jgi:probable rRNA maturation factor